MVIAAAMPADGTARLLADAVLLGHLGYVAFVVAGFVAVPLGALAGWRWVRNRTFRTLHLAAIALVAAEALAGWMCPLTWLELRLRGGPARSLMGRLVEAVLYYDLPPWVFTTAYAALVLLAVVLWWRVPPRRRGAGQPA